MEIEITIDDRSSSTVIELGTNRKLNPFSAAAPCHNGVAAFFGPKLLRIRAGKKWHPQN
jgi:hypothetical protein